ncbi:MAG: hypothetical protein ETSY2_22250 [Candidatus Entotheonella gemina]|uniref:DUF2306 domain-containing protein n=1 Tax=Candidatus Entotheonella gemina TaxID=1429439 RepID=W4M6J5_9BACT|nr:hypothetical protein [Candidatus Entotheonella palauensis]ETX05561.1 MAG: hypothetical protein ETSY2_22250 [Candidatus Entotheonella gemina]
MLFNTLLILHITAGFTALVTAFVAIFSKLINVAHQWHLYSGRIYFWAMFVIFVTSIPMSILHPNLFLFLISIFSFYYALTGWRLAKNRRGTPQLIDWTTASIMSFTSIVMILYGSYMLISHTNGIILLVFGVLGSSSGYRDFKRLRAGGVRGQARIAEHLSGMMGATIATITAFLNNNVTFHPEVVVWLGPTLVISPLIVWWNRQLRQGRRVKGAETPVLQS